MGENKLLNRFTSAVKVAIRVYPAVGGIPLRPVTDWTVYVDDPFAVVWENMRFTKMKKES